MKSRAGFVTSSKAGLDVCPAGVVVPPEVLQRVCAIAQREAKPNQPVMLAALMLCKPPTSQVRSKIGTCCIIVVGCLFTNSAGLRLCAC